VVEDTRNDDWFEFEVQASDALAAFNHPYAYAPDRETVGPLAA
jgi:hypothetical protein